MRTRVLGLGTMIFAIVVCMGQNQSPVPPGSTPPTFSPEQSKPESAQPNLNAPPLEPKPAPAKELSSGEVKHQLDSKLASEPELKGVAIHSKVTNSTLTLSGNLDNAHQHDIVLRIAHSYHGERKIVDHTAVTDASTINTR